MTSQLHNGRAISGSARLDTTRRRAWLAPIHPSLRLDLTLSHVMAAAARLGSGNPEGRQARLETHWGGVDAVAFLSVRSALAALLEAVPWPAGSEILVTGINIADVIRVISAFGYVAVPIDLDPATLSPDQTEIAEKINPSTRALLVAHLFGGHVDMEPLVNFARQHQLLVIEDCAQAFTTRQAIGARQSDVRLFSFGLLKTGTALGGAIAEVGDAALRQAMRNIQLGWARQSRSTYAGKVAKAFMLVVLQRPAAYGFFSRACRVAGSSSGDVLRNFTRGFGAGDTSALLRALQRRPSAPLLAMLALRIATDNGVRITSRAATGEQMMEALADLSCAGLVCLGSRQARHSHWLVPVAVAKPDGLRRDLLREGFDAHGASNVIAIGGPQATAMIEGLVFVPCYPEMDDETRARVRNVVREHCRPSGDRRRRV